MQRHRSTLFPDVRTGCLGCYWDPTMEGSTSLCGGTLDDYWTCGRKDSSMENYTVHFGTGTIRPMHIRMEYLPVRCRRGGICPPP